MFIKIFDHNSSNNKYAIFNGKKCISVSAEVLYLMTRSRDFVVIDYENTSGEGVLVPSAAWQHHEDVELTEPVNVGDALEALEFIKEASLDPREVDVQCGSPQPHTWGQLIGLWGWHEGDCVTIKLPLKNEDIELLKEKRVGVIFTPDAPDEGGVWQTTEAWINGLKNS